MENLKVLCVTLIVLFFYFLIPSPLSAGAPTEQLRTTVEKVLTILQDPGIKSEGGKRDRNGQLRQVIFPRFDFTEMAKRSLGSHWRQRTPQEQQEFVKIFADLLGKSYVDKIESYGGEKIVYTREVQDENYAEVDTRIFAKKGENLSITYKLHDTNGDWKVYDVVIDHISLINNYRSQFNRILSTGSFDDLIKRLQEKRLNGSGSDTSRLDPAVLYWLVSAQRRF